VVDRPPWSIWWQTDLPCRFTPAEASVNLALLNDVLGESWINKATGSRSNHPLGAEWATNGVNAFLQLNALADDIRLLRETAGFTAYSMTCAMASNAVRLGTF
jgi:hypothetical protein